MTRTALQFPLLLLQAFHLLVLLLHDWVPLGRLNNVRAMQAAHPRHLLLIGTLVSSLLPGIGFALSLLHPGLWPLWLVLYLAGAYLFLFIGEIEAWWAGYFFGYRRDRAASYGVMYGRTLAFLPERHGICPNALHVALHGATLLTLVTLALWLIA